MDDVPHNVLDFKEYSREYLLEYLVEYPREYILEYLREYILEYLREYLKEYLSYRKARTKGHANSNRRAHSVATDQPGIGKYNKASSWLFPIQSHSQHLSHSVGGSYKRPVEFWAT